MQPVSLLKLALSCQMVEDFYNCDFGESIADSKTEPSQEECRFMKDGHYEIAPPFKD